jgi:hypothetical protein
LRFLIRRIVRRAFVILPDRCSQQHERLSLAAYPSATRDAGKTRATIQSSEIRSEAPLWQGATLHV